MMQSTQPFPSTASGVLYSPHSKSHLTKSDRVPTDLESLGILLVVRGNFIYHPCFSAVVIMTVTFFSQCSIVACLVRAVVVCTSIICHRMWLRTVKEKFRIWSGKVREFHFYDIEWESCPSPRTRLRSKVR